MLSHNILSAFSEHGDTWCLDVHNLSRYMADGERKLQPRLPKVNGAVAVIPIQGVITKRGGWFSDGTDRVSRTLDAAMASKAVGGIVLDIDSPGGSSYGLMEFADKIYSLRGAGKPIIAIANPLAASAAIWAGSAADQFIVTPSGDVGSVGVWSLHIDYSAAMEAEGVKPTLIFAGKYKVEGNPYEPLTDEARAEMQRSVDETYSDFLTAMARNRGTTKAKVLADFGEGRVLSAARAKAAGMVDRIASLDDVLVGMGATGGSRGAEATAATEEKFLQAVWNDEQAAPAKDTTEFVGHIDALKRKRERERSRA
jgi:signal peptide peptidase SppA